MSKVYALIVQALPLVSADEGGQRILRIHESQNYKGFDGKLDGARGALFKRFLKAIGQILPTEIGCRPAAIPGHSFERSTPNDGDSAEKSPPKTIAVALEEQIGAPPSVVASGRGFVAEKILDLAFANDVKVREDADLVQILAAMYVDSPHTFSAPIALT